MPMPFLPCAFETVSFAGQIFGPSPTFASVVPRSSDIFKFVPNLFGRKGPQVDIPFSGESANSFTHQQI